MRHVRLFHPGDKMAIVFQYFDSSMRQISSVSRATLPRPRFVFSSALLIGQGVRMDVDPLNDDPFLGSAFLVDLQSF